MVAYPLLAVTASILRLTNIKLLVSSFLMLFQALFQLLSYCVQYHPHLALMSLAFRHFFLFVCLFWLINYISGLQFFTTEPRNRLFFHIAISYLIVLFWQDYRYTTYNHKSPVKLIILHHTLSSCHKSLGLNTDKDLTLKRLFFFFFNLILVWKCEYLLFIHSRRGEKTWKPEAGLRKWTEFLSATHTHQKCSSFTISFIKDKLPF